MIPFNDLAAQLESIRNGVDEAIKTVLSRGQYILGEEMARFEEEFAAYVGAQAAVGVASGTDAITLALRAAGVGPGDEVITVPNTAVPTLAAIVAAGATPVLADIDEATLLMSPEAVRAAVTPRTRAIVPVHLYGTPCPMDELLALANEHELVVIEDACQAHGARYRGRRVGTFGDAGCFSFYPTKNLGGYGDGGAVVTEDPALAERLRLLRNYGLQDRTQATVHGVNSRLDEVQAAILRVKLCFLDNWNVTRRALAEQYARGLASAEVSLPAVPPEAEPVHHLFVVRSPQRDALQAVLADQGIQTLIHYPIPIHLHDVYAGLGYGEGAFPVAERAAREVLSLPLYPTLDVASVNAVVEVMQAFSSSTVNVRPSVQGTSHS